MDLIGNNLQGLICHKLKQKNNQTNKQKVFNFDKTFYSACWDKGKKKRKKNVNILMNLDIFAIVKM